MRVKGVPFRAWPASHRKAFEIACGGKSLSTRERATARWKIATHRSVKKAWGLWLDYLWRHGIEFDVEPGDTVRKERVDDFIRELLGRVRYSTAASYLRDVGIALREMQPGFDLSYLRAAAHDLARASTLLRDDQTIRTSSSVVYEAALGRMDASWERSLSEWRDALVYLDGLKLAIFVLAEVRLRTLALTEPRHFISVGASYELHYAASETKTQITCVVPLPAQLTKYIDHAKKVADWLAHKNGKAEADGLWMTRAGNRMSHGQTYARSRVATKQEVNVALNPQRLRRLGPTSLQRFAPTRTVLATISHQHHSPRITDGYIKASGTAGAIELHHLLVSRYSKRNE